MYPPFKTSAFAYAPYKFKQPWDIFTHDFPNETLGQRFDKVSYKFGIDFNLSYSLKFNGQKDEDNLNSHEKNSFFNVQPIQTINHGTCFKVQPKFSLTSKRYRLRLSIDIDDSLKYIDKPTKIITYLTSNNTWQGVAISAWPRTTPSKLYLEPGSSYFYTMEQTEQLFEEGLEQSEECWRTHIENSNCTVCQFASIADLPMCSIAF